MSYPALSTRVIGQAEKTLTAILTRLLAGTGLTEPGWVVLTLAAGAGGTLDRDAFAAEVARTLKIDEAAAHAHLDALATEGFLAPAAGLAAPQVTVTAAARELHGRIRATVGDITARLWGDLPPDDLAVAGRVLTIVTERAGTELARLSRGVAGPR